MNTENESLLRGIQPREWQKIALDSWRQSMSGIVKVVTGGGKTVFAYLCIEEFFRRHPGGIAVILVPTVALLDQWYLDLLESTSLKSLDVAGYSGTERPEKPSKVNVVVINSGRSLDLGHYGDAPRMLVVDECHRAASGENVRALDGDWSATLGLSATPEREQDDGFSEHLVPLLGPLVFAYDYSDALRDGVIVDFELVNVEIGVDRSAIDYDEVRREARRLAQDSGQEMEDVERILTRKALEASTSALRILWAAKLSISHPGERVVVFHERISALQKIVQLIETSGRNCVSYNSSMSDAHRRDNLSLFRKGAVSTLVTCRALDEGANVPESSVAVVAASTASTRQRIQRLGRVLRPATNKRHAVVYTLFSTEEERSRLAAESTNLKGLASCIWKRGGVRAHAYS